MDGFAASEERSRRARVYQRPGLPATRSSIRLAREHELEAIAALFRPALDGYRGTSADAMLDAYTRDLVDGVRDRFEVGETYVAVLEGRIAGAVAFYRNVALEGWSNLPAGWAGFRALVVDPAVRGAGVGRALVERCLERGRESGSAVLGIHSADCLSHAVQLYERMGFVRCPEFDLLASVAFPLEGEDDMIAIAFRYDLR